MRSLVNGVRIMRKFQSAMQAQCLTLHKVHRQSGGEGLRAWCSARTHRGFATLPPTQHRTLGEVDERGILQTEFTTYRFTRRPGKQTGYGRKKHRSNRAKRGLYHGKDVQFGNKVSFSVRKTRRRWMPNVQNKRVFSLVLDEWVRFKMTTTALKQIDRAGGIDNYLMGLDDAQVADSNYVTKQRNRIAAALFHKGELSEKIVRRLGYHKNPPAPLTPADAADAQAGADAEDAHLIE